MRAVISLLAPRRVVQGVVAPLLSLTVLTDHRQMEDLSSALQREAQRMVPTQAGNLYTSRPLQV